MIIYSLLMTVLAGDIYCLSYLACRHTFGLCEVKMRLLRNVGVLQSCDVITMCVSGVRPEALLWGLALETTQWTHIPNLILPQIWVVEALLRSCR